MASAASASAAAGRDAGYRRTAGVLILWGYNPSFTRLTHATAAVAALKRGMRLIVIDPRHVGLASKADLWLRVRPGTDGALALGLANVMIERGWYDRDFIRDWSNGPHLVRADTGRLLTERDLDAGRRCAPLARLGRCGRRGWCPTTPRLAVTTATARDLALEGEYRIATLEGEVVCHPAFELYARLCRRYPPEAVEAICWIPRAQLEEAARLIWQSRAGRPITPGAGMSSTPTSRRRRARCRCSMRSPAVSTAPGGNVLFPAPPAAPITGEDLPAATAHGPDPGPRRAPARAGALGLCHRPRSLPAPFCEGQPYPVRALIGFGANMLLAHADGAAGARRSRSWNSTPMPICS